jgi:hypothetical protein
MFKKCPHCGFKNPADVGECLVCKKDLPTTTAEIREGIEAIKRATKGDWGGVAKKTIDETVDGQVSSLKYRFHPVWLVKAKVHKIKRAFTSLIWILLIIAGLAVFGLIANFSSRIF